MFDCSAVDWEFLTIGDEHYLIVSNAQHKQSTPITTVSSAAAAGASRPGETQHHDLDERSTMYRWQGIDKFVPVHHLATRPCADWESFKMNGETFLVYAGTTDNVSEVLKAKLK